MLQVSWVRHRDVHLLAVGRYTYTNDQRFRVIHRALEDDWVLLIKFPQHRDSGIYECQVSTTPHMSHFVHLEVVGEFYFILFLFFSYISLASRSLRVWSDATINGDSTGLRSIYNIKYF